jgi:hypothetical protein
MAELIGLGIFVAAVVMLVFLASRRRRLHGGSMRAEHGNLGMYETPPEDRWFPGRNLRSSTRHGMGRRRSY